MILVNLVRLWGRREPNALTDMLCITANKVKNTELANIKDGTKKAMRVLEIKNTIVTDDTVYTLVSSFYIFVYLPGALSGQKVRVQKVLEFAIFRGLGELFGCSREIYYTENLRIGLP